MTDNIVAKIEIHESLPWPPVFFIKIYDNGLLVKEIFCLFPFRKIASLQAKIALKIYRKNRFKLKENVWEIT